MPTSYPTTTDSYTTKVDGVSDVLAADINNLQDAMVAVQNNAVKRGSPSMTGNLTITNASPTINMVDTDNVTRYLHVNGNLMGFLKSDSNWDMYMNNSGQMWTANYGWLHDTFFNAVGNCGGVQNAINCYGSGDLSANCHHELIDNGGTVTIRTVNVLYNCNCACTNCQCDCGW